MDAIARLAEVGRAVRLLGGDEARGRIGGCGLPRRVVLGRAGALGTEAGGVGGGGGAGGVGGGTVGRNVNLRVVMTSAVTGPAAEEMLREGRRAVVERGSAGLGAERHLRATVRLCETRDRNDRAHAVRDPDGMLLNGAAVPNARPRRYAPSQMTSRGVAFDSGFDETHARQVRLDGVAGIGRRAGAAGDGVGSVNLSAAEAARRDAAIEALRRGESLRRVVESRGPRERALLSAEDLVRRAQSGQWKPWM